MFSSEIFHNFHETARKQKTLPAAAGFWTRDLQITRSMLYQLSYTVRTDQRLEIMNYVLNVIGMYSFIYISKTR